MKRVLVCCLAIMLIWGGIGLAEEVSVLTEPIAQTPILLTSAGQSADFEMVKIMLTRNNLECGDNMTAQPEDLQGYKTLILAIGGSSKGLGAAGINADDELARVEAVVAAAEEQEMTIIAVHIGGSGRRGPLGDRYIEPSVAYADYVIVVNDGNQDGLFTTLAEQYEVPVDYIDNMTDMLTLLPKVFE